ncbi:MAG: hypothetical protein ACFFB7_08125, partial [Candidatus Sifarchaeia archaeon]
QYFRIQVQVSSSDRSIILSQGPELIDYLNGFLDMNQRGTLVPWEKPLNDTAYTKRVAVGLSLESGYL